MILGFVCALIPSGTYAQSVEAKRVGVRFAAGISRSGQTGYDTDGTVSAPSFAVSAATHLSARLSWFGELGIGTFGVVARAEEASIPALVGSRVEARANVVQLFTGIEVAVLRGPLPLDVLVGAGVARRDAGEVRLLDLTVNGQQTVGGWSGPPTTQPLGVIGLRIPLHPSERFGIVVRQLEGLSDLSDDGTHIRTRATEVRLFVAPFR